ncbi:hypothetical protein TorRG33x02_277210, partial [Trema orientale]
GHLLELSDLVETSEQLMNFLITRHAKTKKTEEKWFDFYGQPTRFSMHEFASISGLNCRTFSSSHKVDLLKSNRKLKVDYFGDKRITLDELETHFFEMKTEKGKFKKKMNDIKTNCDHLRVALIYYVEGVILSHERKNNILEEYIGLVEDLEVFNKYL